MSGFKKFKLSVFSIHMGFIRRGKNVNNGLLNSSFKMCCTEVETDKAKPNPAVTLMSLYLETKAAFLPRSVQLLLLYPVFVAVLFTIISV